MSIVLGIDVGGSLTKLVAADGDKPIYMLQVETDDPVTSLYGGIGRIFRAGNLKPTDISAVYLTGVGSSFIDEQVFNIKTYKIPEFNAIGTGALRLSGLCNALVVSMGTGTAFVRAASDECVHIGGTGVGGGTILGLSAQLSCRRDIDTILALAETGDLKNVDLLIKDIANRELLTLPFDMTASNFGKLRSPASNADIALGVINMVFETIGMMALFALRNDTLNDIVLTGTLATFPQAKPIFDKFAEMSGKRFVILPEAVFSTAIGALPQKLVGGSAEILCK